jgi:hypothetical protein
MWPSREGEMTLEHGLLKKFGINSGSDKCRGDTVHRYLRGPLYINQSRTAFTFCGDLATARL